MTYARSRLLVGITGVGFWVLAAIAFLAADGAASLPGTDATASEQVAALAAVLGVYIVCSLPFDILGGLVLPRRHGRASPPPGNYVVIWARGVLVQAIAMAVAVLAVIAAGRAGGEAWAVATVAVLAAIVGVGRRPLATAVADLERLRAGTAMPGVEEMTATDPGFTGGITDAGRIVVPSAWRSALGDDLEVEVTRRRWLAGWPYALGLLLAIAWTAGGAALSMSLPGGGATSVAEVVAAGAWFTLWSFIGLLVLPSVSRPAVFAADAAARAEFPADRVARVIRTLDRLQDDEPERPAAVEAIFHPIPGADRRIARDATVSRIRPWHVARLSLPMSWCLLGFLGRAVHCNAGRPELWVMLPSD